MSTVAELFHDLDDEWKAEKADMVSAMADCVVSNPGYVPDSAMVFLSPCDVVDAMNRKAERDC